MDEECLQRIRHAANESFVPTTVRTQVKPWFRKQTACHDRRRRNTIYSYSGQYTGEWADGRASSSKTPAVSERNIVASLSSKRNETKRKETHKMNNNNNNNCPIEASEDLPL
eukprot:CAMPEP_0206462386 /NCGR_PEP_ID=MMETSP0324_2-20121206/25955_1 /ASSEMBLY_ACC=CAM_ASM_000836 /TAXON_ID=2866 /ORGANISM="Crypthecodinium cohnii, Strain Seligo" /LENGTH=111 /DNA_ID=CAMNT_0053934547 /DNA_START=362 /DNA_END=693 /DNA_ORIENTATION=+